MARPKRQIGRMPPGGLIKQNMVRGQGSRACTFSHAYLHPPIIPHNLANSCMFSDIFTLAVFLGKGVFSTFNLHFPLLILP